MPTQQQRTASARERILDATQLLVSEGGSTAASMGAIGEAAGMSRGAANFHFGSKDELLQALLDRTGARIAERIADLDATAGSPRDRFEAGLESISDDLPTLRAWSLLAYEALGASPFLLGTINTHRWHATEFVMDTFDLERSAAQLVLASGTGIMLQHFLQPGAFDLQAALRQAADTLF